ncbi:MAG: VanW family protein [Acidimicrobiia bacterium]
MPRRLRIALLSAIPITVLLLPVVVYAFDRAVTNGEVTRNVFAAGIDLGGLGRDDAVAALDEYEATLADQPLTFVIAGHRFTLPAADIGLDVDTEAVVDVALAQRQKGFFSGFFDWIDGFADEITIPFEVGYDAIVLDDLLTAWEIEAVEEPAYNGSVVVVDGRALPESPRAGEGIERPVAHRLVANEIQTTGWRPLRVPTLELAPELTDDDIDEVVEEANRLIGSEVVLRAEDPPFELVFTPEQLTSAFFIDMKRNSPITFDLGFDRAAVAALVAPYRQELERPARSAEFIVDEEAQTVALIPGRSETLVDIDLVLAELTEAARSVSGLGQLKLAEGQPAEFTTAQAEAMMPMTLVSTFTTRHAAGQDRVHNIHTMADAVDGAVVQPGAEFSLNEHVGQRTTEKGYLPAPMIEGGKLVDSVGGGVSQFATTFYNAVFEGCYRDITHKPHSFYISRYPEVNEATVSWPEPNLIFRNDSFALIIVKTEYTSNSITVSFYGNNGGKTCERRLGSRSAFTTPKDTFEPNAELNPGEQDIVQSGIRGFTNSVTRVITYAHGTVEEQEWSWRYRPLDTIIEVHPCMIIDPEAAEGEQEECPIEVPDLAGQASAAAVAALEGAGFVVATGPEIDVTDPALDGVVVAQSVPGGDFLAGGSTITIQIGKFTPPPPPPPPPP